MNQPLKMAIVFDSVTRDRTTYQYDSQRRRTCVEVANGSKTSFSYDANSQMTDVIHSKSDTSIINSFAYAYDGGGNRTSILEATGDRTTYTYDATNQLASEHRTGNQAHRTTFTYDDSGNRIKKERDAVLTRFEYDAGNQLTAQIDAGGRTTYTFDANGNQEVVLEPNADRTTTTWDYENQPRAYEKPTNALTTMTYNADNRRVCKESASAKSNFVWDVEGDNVLLETDDFNVTQATYTNKPTTFGSLISQRRNSATNWYCFDALGSTWNLTNASETITDSYIYDAWGNVLNSTGTITNPFQYVGQSGYYYDTETNSNYVRARVYQPTIARWWSADPLGFVDGLNLYLYVGNELLNAMDPSGNAPCSALCMPWPNPFNPAPGIAAPVPSLKERFEKWYLAEKASMGWEKKIPNCPCKLDVKDYYMYLPGKGEIGFAACVWRRIEWTEAENPDSSIWGDPAGGFFVTMYHLGAAFCMRSKKNKSYGGSAQQCCYDSSGELITHGSGAGTPDRSDSGISILDHRKDDVIPYDWAISLDRKIGRGEARSGEFTKKYLEVRPPNNGNKCAKNP